LIAAANIIIISTAECERAFSNMNIILTIRCSMHLVQCSFHQWDPLLVLSKQNTI
jgi:hypothetical protein